MEIIIIILSLLFRKCSNMCGTPQARAPERGAGLKEQVAGPRGMDPLGPVPEYLILHHSWARGVSQ